MTASLYQSGSRGCAAVGTLTSGKVVEILFAAHMVTDAQDMGGGALRIEGDEVARPSPHVARAGEHIVRLEPLPGRQAHRGQIDLEEARLRVIRVEIDDGEHGLAAILTRLAVGEERIV